MKVRMSNNKKNKMKKSVYFILSLCIISLMIISHGCKKKGDPPQVTTLEITDITNNSAKSGGNIISDGGCEIIEKGVCWNTTGNPTVESDQKTMDGKGSDNFTSNLTTLQSGTIYYVRAYATNGPGTTYGDETSFTTKVADADGNLYNTVKIGTQVWMVENLKTTKYNDASEIPNVTDNDEWRDLNSDAYCWANNDETANKPIYGALYNWHAVETGKLCPTGWHVPTDDDFKVLEIALGMVQAEADGIEWRGTNQGSQLKSDHGWLEDGNGTNSSGFTAPPSGYRYYGDGTSKGLGLICYFWTSTPSNEFNSLYRRLDAEKTTIYRSATHNEAGKSVRCVKND